MFNNIKEQFINSYNTAITERDELDTKINNKEEKIKNLSKQFEN